MPIGIAEIDGIVVGIGVAVDVDAGEDGIPAVGRDEAAEGGIEIAGAIALSRSCAIFQPLQCD
jgi:hypothetical protein